jgi:hypothetical protein
MYLEKKIHVLGFWDGKLDTYVKYCSIINPRSSWMHHIYDENNALDSRQLK